MIKCVEEWREPFLFCAEFSEPEYFIKENF